ncbi:MAG: molecular chaperone [Gammaproteobacteria bacterium]|nr:molecular chaperone [Gammaproteobacteria bacterium]
MRRILALISLLLVPLWAQAASFQVSPIRITLSADHSTDVIRVTNSSDTPTVVQLQIVAWAQENGDDVYTPSRNLLATPPIFTVAPGSQQVVRVGMRTQPDASQETCYRMYLTEVPPAPTKEFRGVQIALRMGIPVFVDPLTATEPKLRWSGKLLSPGELQVSATNTGNAHAQVLKWQLQSPDQSRAWSQESGSYVLPGATHTWTLKLTSPLAANTPLEVLADTDRGTRHAQLVLEK